MCSSTPKLPKPVEQKPVPPPPPAPEAPPTAPKMNEGVQAQGKGEKAGKTGTRSLRIDLNLGGGATNPLNIPG